MENEIKADNTENITGLAEEIANPQAEPPRPLMRELPQASPFPVGALGAILGDAANAIHDKVQAPLAICAQSVLAVAALAVQGHANVILPMGQVRPLSNFFMSIAESGERKSSSDNEAMRPVYLREKELQAEYDALLPDYKNDTEAWDSARKIAVKKCKGNRTEIKIALDRIGPEPIAPLTPILICTEPTLEGLCRLYSVGHPAIGIFSAEGGQFIGGHGMNPDNKMRTVTGLSSLWDGAPLKRVRAGDGASSLPGRRLSAHLMAQPDIAQVMLADDLLLGQGFLSRQLITAPDTTAGTRLWRDPDPASSVALDKYEEAILDILRLPLPLVSGKLNELDPRNLPLSATAQMTWIDFANYIEKRIAPGGELEPIRSLANKLPEHATRLAGVLALVENINMTEISDDHMNRGIELANHYIREALRLFGASRINPELRLAQRLLEWLQTSWQEPLISLPDIYQSSLNAISNQKTAGKIVETLELHGWLERVNGGGVVKGKRRRDVWRIASAT